MTSISTIILFFIYLWGLGFTATYWSKKPEDFLERNLVYIAIGLAVFPILAIILNFLHIPLDWKIFLALSLIIPLYNLKNYKQFQPSFKLKIKKSHITLFLVFIIFFTSLFMYTKGAFSYPYLENDDPWGHAIGVKYVALEKNAFDPDVSKPGRDIDPVLSYIDPYPPAYDILLGILHQTSEDLTWTLKFFNALIISLGLLFFYLFAKLFTKSRNKALFATFILAAIPSYLSHFIWAHSLVITILFPALYAFISIQTDKKWMYPAALSVASIWVTQNISQPIKLTTLLVIFIIVGSITYKKFFKYETIALVSGGILSLFWWGVILTKYPINVFLGYYEGSKATVTGAAASSIFSKLLAVIKAITNPSGTASRAYTFSDFFIAQKTNMINNPIGVGVFLSILTLIGIAYVLIKYRGEIVKQENAWICITLFWLIFTFWGVNGYTFPISIAKAAFRVWMIMAIPLALIATEGFYFLMKLTKKIPLLKIGIFLFIVAGILLTSGYQKFHHNTNPGWPTTGSFQGQEPFEYAKWFNTIPKNSKVFLLAPREKLTMGFGMYSCHWCQDEIDFRLDILNSDGNRLHSFLKNRGYEYLVVNGRMDMHYLKQTFGNETEQKLLELYNSIATSGKFGQEYQKENMFAVLKVL